jgi:hypothetical protein
VLTQTMFFCIGTTYPTNQIHKSKGGCFREETRFPHRFLRPDGQRRPAFRHFR